MMIDKKLIQKFDNNFFDFLLKTDLKIPKRVGKFLAMYYPDAQIRKKFSGFIGIEMGEGTFANLGLKIVPNENPICLHIGKHVSIGPNVIFLCGTEPNNGNDIRAFQYVRENISLYEDIWIDDEAWLGASSVIFPGVKIGRCSIVGAGSIVREDTEPYTIYAGVPAKKIRNIKTGERYE